MQSFRYFFSLFGCLSLFISPWELVRLLSYFLITRNLFFHKFSAWKHQKFNCDPSCCERSVWYERLHLKITFNLNILMLCALQICVCLSATDRKATNFICTFNAMREKSLFDFFAAVVLRQIFLSSPARNVKQWSSQTRVEKAGLCLFIAGSTLVASETLKKNSKRILFVWHQQKFFESKWFSRSFSFANEFLSEPISAGESAVQVNARFSPARHNAASCAWHRVRWPLIFSSIMSSRFLFVRLASQKLNAPFLLPFAWIQQYSYSVRSVGLQIELNKASLNCTNIKTAFTLWKYVKMKMFSLKRDFNGLHGIFFITSHSFLRRA